MSWLQGSVSSLTGQLSTFTRELLTEGTEEVSDVDTELRLAKSKIQNLEAAVLTQSAECDRLKLVNAELEEKAEAAELQVKHISTEYRARLEEKEAEINELRQLQLSSQSSHSHVLTSDTLHTIPHSYSDSNLHTGDDLDFHDVISSQMEINRLSNELARLRADCQHWKNMASKQEHADPTITPEQVSQLRTDLEDMSHQVQVLNKQLERVQADKSSLSLQMTELTKSRTELAEELARGGEERQQLEMELTGSRSDCKRLEKELDVYRTEKTELEELVTRLQSEQDKLLHENKQASTSTMLQDLQDVRERFRQESGDRLATLAEKRCDIVNEMADIGEQISESRSVVATLEADSDEVHRQTVEMMEQVGSPQHREITQRIVDSLEEENRLLHTHNQQLLAQVEELEHSVSSLVSEREQDEDIMMTLNQEINTLKGNPVGDMTLLNQLRRSDSEQTLGASADSDTESAVEKNTSQSQGTSALGHMLNVHDNTRHKLSPFPKMPNDDTEYDGSVSSHMSSESDLRSSDLSDAVSILQNQVQEYEREIEHFEMVKSDWQNEKDALESVLVKLRDQLKEKEYNLSVLMAQKGLMDLEKQQGGQDSSAEESELDSQLQQLRQELEELQEAKQLLQAEQNDLQETVDHLNMSREDLETSVASLKGKKGNVENLSIELEGLKTQLVTKDEEFSKVHEEKEVLTQELETLDHQHQEALTHLIEIRNQLTDKLEASESELQQTKEEKDGLALELSELKDQNETNIELQKEANRERDKIQQQMYLQKEELENVRKELEDVQQKYREYREETAELEDKAGELNDKLEQMEVELAALRDERCRMEADNRQTVSQLEQEVQRLQERLEEASQAVEENRKEEEMLQEQVEEDDSLRRSREDELKRQLQELQGKIDALGKSVLEKDTLLDALREEKESLLTELHQGDRKLVEQSRQYEKAIQELTRAKDNDEGSLEQEHEKLVKLCQEREFTITELTAKCEQLQGDYEDTKEMLQSTVEGQEQLAEMLKGKDADISSLRDLNNSLKMEQEQMEKVVKEKDSVIEHLEGLEGQITRLRNENISLQDELKQKSASQSTGSTLDIITELESEITELNQRLSEQDADIGELSDIVAEKDTTIGQLEETIAMQKATLEEFENIEKHQDNEVSEVQTGLKEKVEDVESNHVCHLDVEVQTEEKIVPTEQSSEKVIPCEECTKHLQSLEGIEAEIQKLRKENVSLTSLLEQKTNAVENDRIINVDHTQEKIHALAAEKEQILGVLNEKMRECSSLKGEIHRLVDEVTADKASIAQLNEHNKKLSEQLEGPNKDMSKEAIQNLSRIINDKDMEIEALKQKSDTLLQVLQDSGEQQGGASTAQYHQAVQERDMLQGQVHALLSERQQLATAINTQYQDNVQLQEVVRTVQTELTNDTYSNTNLQVDYNNLVLQLEEKQKALNTLQEEALKMRQMLQDITKAKDRLFEDRKQTNSLVNDNLQDLNESIESQTKSIEEKDLRIQALTEEVRTVAATLSMREGEVTYLQGQVQSLQAEIRTLQEESDRNIHRANDKDTEAQTRLEVNKKLTALLQEKELENTGLSERVGVLERLVKEHAQGASHAQTLMTEAEDQQKQISSLLETKRRLEGEVGRLREHLLQVEDGYTQEALLAEEREKDLRNRLAIAEEKVFSSSTAAESANLQASAHVEDLLGQIRALTTQRDTANLQLSQAQEQVQQYALSLSNLQVVMERFQQEEKAMYASELEKYKKDAELARGQLEQLVIRNASLQEELDEAKEALEGAARLTEQMDRKEEHIMALQHEVDERDHTIEEYQHRLDQLASSNEASVEKLLVKNLLIGYFMAPPNKKPDVLKLIGSVLSFDMEEMEKVGAMPRKGWLTGWWGKKDTSPTQHPPSSPSAARGDTSQLDSSFTQMFVKFLETESTPTLQPRLPAEEMAREQQQRRKVGNEGLAFNPFTAPLRSSTAPATSGPGDAHPLMKTVPVPMLTSAPLLVPESGNAIKTAQGTTSKNSDNVLREILQQ
ncbi:thyroid receptor-interacting protein 11-like [Branchiostoma floridae]|uniref:Thyroid receptor-interacting protein 11-like n=1 Tax=Branchiostoma floridae TaxID=7739 RepID=A0A9J7KV23_BRAFL|nr:thyroid receptor-interacting protein 11-like [Branchiostoma floridae]